MEVEYGWRRVPFSLLKIGEKKSRDKYGKIIHIKPEIDSILLRWNVNRVNLGS